jgi:hypothetical protein
LIEPGVETLRNNRKLAFDTLPAVVPAGSFDRSNWIRPVNELGPPTLTEGLLPLAAELEKVASPTSGTDCPHAALWMIAATPRIQKQLL